MGPWQVSHSLIKMLLEKSRFYDFTISYDEFQMKSNNRRDKYDIERRDVELLK